MEVKNNTEYSYIITVIPLSEQFLFFIKEYVNRIIFNCSGKILLSNIALGRLDDNRRTRRGLQQSKEPDVGPRSRCACV